MHSAAISVSTITPCFRGEQYLAKFLESVAAQTIFEEIEVVLDHNEPSECELEMVREFQERYPGRLQHIVVRPVEPIGASMNRCIRQARGRYVAIWNVDDLRAVDSLQRQRDVLDAYSDMGLTYGDFVVVREFGSTQGEYVAIPEFHQEEFTRGMLGGPFYMWRKELSERAGYFDEQLVQGPDFDLLVRLAFNTLGKKTEGLLGHYLNAGTGLGSRKGTLQPVDRTAIELRYGILDKVDYGYLRAAQCYRINEIFFNRKWHPVASFVPDYAAVMRAREPLRSIGIQNHRRRVVKRCLGLPMLHSLGRWVLQRVGLLEQVRTVRARCQLWNRA